MRLPFEERVNGRAAARADEADKPASRRGQRARASGRMPLIDAAAGENMRVFSKQIRSITIQPSAPAPIADPTARIDRWGAMLTLFITGLLGVVIWRVSVLQLAPDPRLAMYVSDHSGAQRVPAIRGDLVDRRGRLLATTRFGSRAFVDPTRLADPPDETIVRLAEIVGEDPGPMGERIVNALAYNREVLEAQLSAETAGPQTDEQARAKLVSTIKRVFSGFSSSRDGSDEMAGDENSEKPLRLRRYVRVSGVLSDEQIAAVKALELPGVHVERGPVRAYTPGDLAASLIGKVGIDGAGLLGAELANDARLTGKSGRVRYIRDAWNRALWIEVGDYVAADHGSEVRLSIDIELQRIAQEELEKGVATANAAGGRLVMLDPASGEILAMVDIVRDLPEAVPFEWVDKGVSSDRSADTDRDRYITLKADPGRDVHPALGRNRCVEDVYEPGSTLKSIVWASVTELGLVDPDEMFDTEGGAWRVPYGRRVVKDVNNYDALSWFDVLVHSSNIGMVKGASRASFAELHDAVRRFGFGTKTDLTLPGETRGIVTSLGNWNDWTHTSVSFGYEIAVTPVQMVRAYAAFARTGDRAGTIPRSLSLIAHEQGQGPVDVRVISPETARLTREAMAQVARNLDKTIETFGYGHQDWSYTLFGKSGTAKIPLGKAPDGKRAPRGYKGYFPRQYTTSFIAGAPAEHPRVIVIVIIDDPGPDLVRRNRYYGSHVAGPVVRKVVERSLKYMGVEPSPGMRSWDN
jgi:cell division protein FtsI (penicillin-binding protein 3)